MNGINKSRAALLVLAGALLAGAGYWAGSRTAESGADAAATTVSSALKLDPTTGKRVLYWHDPMVPGKRFDKPGKSPFMDMQLVPVYAEEDGAMAGVRISPALQQNLGIRFATVRRAQQAVPLELVGSTRFDESRVEVLQSRVAGFVDKLHVRAPLQTVKRGQVFASVFVPDWLAPQEEYLALKRHGDMTLLAAARQRMRALSIPDAMVAEIDRTGRPQSHLVLYSPVSGTVSELAVREGAQVTPGMTIATVAGMDTMWLLAEVPEALVGTVRPGMRASAQVAGDPQRTYNGTVSEILPGVSAATRTVQARVVLDNRDGSLIPGMLMRVRLSAAKPESLLLVPSEAIIASGKRSIVYVAEDDKGMRPVVVTPGRELGDETEILAGLREGQRVVASGQFLVDSEANLKSIVPRSPMAPAAPPDETRPAPAVSPGGKPVPAPRTTMPAAAPPAKNPAGPAATSHQGTGKVEQISDEAITLSHGPIASLKWPPMTMDFNKPGPDAFKEIRPGQTVEFSFVENEDGYELTRVVAVEGGKP